MPKFIPESSEQRPASLSGIQHELAEMAMNTKGSPAVTIRSCRNVDRLMKKPIATLVATILVLGLPQLSFAADTHTSCNPPAIRGEIVLSRDSHAWMSQQIEEPCILPNPKTPGRLMMFYSAVSSSNRVVAAIGKAWADTRDPFHWHQDTANPIFRPARRGWDCSTIRLDAVLYIPEEDAYYRGRGGSRSSLATRSRSEHRPGARLDAT
jgi:hypothetical protein